MTAVRNMLIERILGGLRVCAASRDVMTSSVVSCLESFRARIVPAASSL
jgi:hypothetical protein